MKSFLHGLLFGLAIGIPLMVALYQLDAKKPVELRPELMVLAYEKSGDIGLHMHVYLDRPRAWAGTIEVTPNHAGHWKVTEINGFLAEPYIPSMKPQPALIQDKQGAWIENLDRSKRYRFDITLLPTCKEARVTDLLMFITLPDKIQFIPAVER